MQFHEGSDPILAIGQIVIGGFFIVMMIKNFRVWDYNVARISETLPVPRLALVIGFAVQAVGGTLVMLDFRADIGAILLMIFTVAASALFHRYWSMEDPIRRTYHMLLLSSNVAQMGGLLMIFALSRGA
jgi:putative oxidoreductase